MARPSPHRSSHRSIEEAVDDSRWRHAFPPIRYVQARQIAVAVWGMLGAPYTTVLPLVYGYGWSLTTGPSSPAIWNWVEQHVAQTGCLRESAA